MTIKLLSTQLAFGLTAFLAHAQGTFQYDQQSSTEGLYLEGGAAIEQNQPFGQSFTPQLSSVGFIRLYIYNGLLGNTGSATIYVNIRSDSISGPIVGTSTVVHTPGGLFAGTTDFLFANPVTVTPGTTYYFQPVVQSGFNLGLNEAGYAYLGGTGFFQGTPQTATDVWFREGIVVPEPSTADLALLGGLASLWLVSRRKTL